MAINGNTSKFINSSNCFNCFRKIHIGLNLKNILTWEFLPAQHLKIWIHKDLDFQAHLIFNFVCQKDKSGLFMATVIFLQDLLGLPCLVQLLTWLHVSDYHNFGTMKDDSLLNNILAWNNCLCHRNIFQNGINIISKMVTTFCQKSSKFCIFCTIRFCSNFASMWPKYLSNNVVSITVSVMVT